MGVVEDSFDTSRAVGWRSAVTVAGGLAWIITLAFSWTSRGAGSRLDGVRLANWLAHGPANPSWGRPVSSVLYLLAIAGCLTVTTCTWSARFVTWTRTTLAAAVLVAMVGLGVSAQFEFQRWGPSAWCTLFGSLALLASADLRATATTPRVNTPTR